MRWLAIYVSSQYSGMGRSAEDALPELKAQGVVCTSVRDGRPMFVVPGHEGEVDAQDVVKILRLEVRPGVRPRAPTPPPALAGARSAPAGAPAEKPAEAPPQATIEDGFKWLASWVATNYMGMGKTVEDALPELRRRGISCSSVKGNTPMFRMPGQTTEIDGAQVIKSLRLQARPGVDPSKPSPPRGLVLGTSGAPRKPTATKPPTPSASAAAAKPSPPASAAPKPSPSASAAVATAAASAAARRASSASSKAPSTTKAPPAASSTAKAEPKAAPKAEPKTEPKAEPNPPPEKPPRPLDPDNNIILFLGQLLLPAAATLLAAVAIGGGSILWEKLTTSGVIPSRDELVKQKVTEPGSFKVGGAAPSVTVKPREPVSTPAVEPLPPPPPSPPPPPKIGVQNQGGAVSPLDAQREQELRVIQEQEQRRVQQEERERQQRFREEQEQERVAREQEARAQQLREQQQAKEQEAREQQLREERARQEREQKEREQKEKEEKEKERKEQEQREEEQKEKERKEQEQSEKEQKEKEQKEKEQKEREQKEKEQKEQEQQAQEQKSQEAAAAPPVQAQGLLPQSRPSGVQPLPGALQQGGVQPQPKGGVLPKPYEPYIDPNKPRGVQPLPAQQQREGVQPAPQGPFEPPNQPRGLLPESEDSQPPKIEGPRSIGGGIGGALPSMSGTGPQAQAKQVEQPREEPFKWGAPRQKAEPVSLGIRSKGIQQQGDGKIEGYEACIYRSYGC
ncbi:hypothetical protein DUNSADRAFT_14091 [Dunaliella salina]|uniref:Uncharacterized protein n=1 Tax=Dunaliella salina TaxID=3046 RepID=A0ABQ7G816_DUNSA|nr:hypothetical protein DUNSADRAFT_14091 [Dunaliella salina]|eukprot:KAF5830750.1 hypothetical protein DUNSADRAFT_14091 [Dunaliella salina]